jgi:hypothetical protein
MLTLICTLWLQAVLNRLSTSSWAGKTSRFTLKVPMMWIRDRIIPVDACAHSAQARNVTADEEDKAFLRYHQKTSTGRALLLQQRLIFPVRRWRRIEHFLDGKETLHGEEVYVTDDGRAPLEVTVAEAELLRAKLTSLLTREQKENPDIGVPLIAANEWLFDESGNGWSYIDITTGITYWIDRDALMAIYGKRIVESAQVRYDQERMQSADLDVPYDLPMQMEVRPLPFGCIVFPLSAKKAKLFDFAMGCLDVLRREALPKLEPMRAYAKRRKLDIEKVLLEAVGTKRILFDDVIELAGYLDHDEVENRDNRAFRQRMDDEQQAHVEQRNFVFGNTPSGRRKARVHEEKAVVKSKKKSKKDTGKSTASGDNKVCCSSCWDDGTSQEPAVTRFRLSALPASTKRWKAVRKYGKAVVSDAAFYDGLTENVTVWPKSKKALIRLSRQQLGGFRSIERFNLQQKADKQKSQLLDQEVELGKCTRCNRQRLILAWSPDSVRKNLFCGLRLRDPFFEQEYLVHPGLPCMAPHEQLPHTPWCPHSEGEECTRHKMFLARKPFKPGRYSR